LEIFPGLLSWTTLIILTLLAWLKPVWVAYFIIAFDVYWLLLVIYLGINLFAAYVGMKKNLRVSWRQACVALPPAKANNLSWQEIIHLIIFPTYNESLEVIRPSFEALVQNGYPTDKMIVVLAVEERAGPAGKEKAKINLSKIYYSFVWAQIAFGIILFLFNIYEPKTLIVLGAVINAFAMFVHLFLVFWLNNRSLPEVFRPNLTRKIIIGIIFVFFGVFSFIVLWDKIF